MPRACIANLNNSVCDFVPAVCRTGIHSVYMVDAATHGILLNDTNTH
jgi:hypothetical protein